MSERESKRRRFLSQKKEEPATIEEKQDVEMREPPPCHPPHPSHPSHAAAGSAERDAWEENFDVYDWLHAGVTHHGLVDHYVGTWGWFNRKAMEIPEHFSTVTIPVPTRQVVDIVEVDTRPGKKPILMPPMMEEADSFTAPCTPYESKMRMKSYSCPLYVNLIHTRKVLKEDGSHGETLMRTYYDRFSPGAIPCMVGSSMCWRTMRPEGTTGDIGERWDPGGYFICGDSEKIVTQVITRRKDYIFVFPDMGRRYKYYAECRPREASRWRATSTISVHMHRKKNHFSVSLNFVAMEVPLFGVFRMLGFESVERAARCIMTAGMTSGITPISKDSEFHNPALFNMLTAYMKGEVGSKAFTMQGKANDRVVPNFEELAPEEVMRWVGVHGLRSPKQTTKTPEEKQDHIRKLLITELFPHIGTLEIEATRALKARYLAYMVWVIIQVHQGRTPMDERADFAHKQLETAAFRVLVKFSQTWRDMLSMMKNAIAWRVRDEQHVNIPEIMKANSFSDPLATAMKNGNFAAERSSSAQTGSGVTQSISRLMYMSTLIELRRAKKDVPKNNKRTGTRNIHTSEQGYICPSNTSEGPPCGLSVSLGSLATVTVGASARALHNSVKNLPALKNTLLPTAGVRFDNRCKATDFYSGASEAEIDAMVIRHGRRATWYFVNGIPRGIILDGEAESNKVATALRRARRQGQICRHASVYTDPARRLLYYSAEEGGPRRALIVLDPDRQAKAVYAEMAALSRLPYYRNSPRGLWEALITEGHIEYVDPLEERNLTVRTSPLSTPAEDGITEPPEVYTHSEVHPVAWMSEAVIVIPMFNLNQPTRNTFETCMLKAVLAVIFDMFLQTSGMQSMTLQHPLVQSVIFRAIGSKQIPWGFNPSVMQASYMFFNTEDSISMSRMAVDLGMGMGTSDRVYDEAVSTVKSRGGLESQAFTKPAETALGRKRACYDKIEADGLPRVGDKVGPGDIIIGREATQQDIRPGAPKSATVTRDQSVMALEMGDEARASVKSVMRTWRTPKHEFAAVSLQQIRVPRQGNKFSSRHGQKGTVGFFYNPEDAPVMPDGSVPMMIINPHGQHSRMTQAHTTEGIASLLAIAQGGPVNGTAWDAMNAKQVTAKLRKMGYPHPEGAFPVRNPFTGNLLETKVTVGYQHYQQLKQQIADKRHARNTGPKNPLYLQPVQGKNQKGGMKMGTMEKDCMIGSGAANLVRERMFLSSDATRVPVCRRCGLIGLPNRSYKTKQLVKTKEAEPFCPTCRTHCTMHNIHIPHAFLILYYNLLGAGIAMRFLLSDPRECEEFSASVGVKSAAGSRVWRPKRTRRRIVRHDFGGAAFSSSPPRHAGAPAGGADPRALPRQEPTIAGEGYMAALNEWSSHLAEEFNTAQMKASMG